jgi:hypothetical protein
MYNTKIHVYICILHTYMCTYVITNSYNMVKCSIMHVHFKGVIIDASTTGHGISYEGVEMDEVPTYVLCTILTGQQLFFPWSHVKNVHDPHTPAGSAKISFFEKNEISKIFQIFFSANRGGCVGHVHF